MLNVTNHKENANQIHNEILFIPVRKKKKTWEDSVGNDVEKLKPLHIVGGMQYVAASMENGM